jgi:tetratricopeptide (TPR) repeat protein
MLGPAGESGPLVEFLQRETEGNAFFLVEVVRALAEETDRLADVLKVDLPEHILTGGMNQVVKRRLDRVPKSGALLLQLAAVAGRQIDPAVLRVASGVQDIAGWLITCANAAVLETQETWRFTHDKLRERVLGDLPADETRRLHQRIAEAIESVYGRSTEKHPVLAYHCRRALLHEKAAHYFLESGDESARLFAVIDARDYYAHALEELALLPDTEERRRQRVDTMLKQVTVSWYSVAPAACLSILGEAKSLVESVDRATWSAADHGRAAAIALWQGRVTYVSGKAREALDVFQAGLGQAERSGNVQLEMLLKSSIGQALFVKGHARQALPYLEQALGPLAHSPDGTRVAGVYAVVRALLGDVTEGLSMLQSSLQRAFELKYSTYIALQHIYPALVHLLAEDWPRMLGTARECTRVALEAKDVGVACLGTGFSEWAAVRLDDRAAADEARDQFADLRARVGGTTADDWLPVVEIERALAFGTPEDAIAVAAPVVARVREGANLVGEILALRAWGRALGRLGRYDDAADRLSESLRISDGEGNLLMSARTHVAWADICRARGDVEGAERHLALSASLVR